MPRITTLLLLFFWIFEISAQDEVRLPADLRQHNLTTYNSSLFNPVFSLDRNDPESVAFWTRWQWQSIDADPTTLYLNYTRPFKKNAVLGAAFFQHNTGIFFNTGGVVNYAKKIQFSQSIQLSFGLNLFGFVQELADTRFQIDPSLPIDLPGATNDFILQFAPGASLSVERLTLSMASENLFDYNFRAKEANTPAADKIFMGMMSYDFPLTLASAGALIRPSLYLRTVPGESNQIGILSLLRTKKYWGQLGYNNFYGIGIGAGGTFLKKFSLGALFEFGTSASINSKNPSFELVASYFLGRPEEHDVTAVYEEEMLEETLVGNELEEQQNIKEELEKAEELANEEIEKPEEEEEEPATEKIDKKEQRKAEKEAAVEEKRLTKEKAQKAKEEQAQIAKAQKEAQARREAEAKEAEKAEEQKEELRKAEELAAEREAEQKREVETKEVAQKREADAKAEALRIASKKRQDSIAEIQKAARETAQQASTKRRLDSLNDARKARAEVEAQRKLDSVAKAKTEKEEVKPEAGEKYEEVQTEDGLEPGFYLIANVFGTKKYFDAFMADLTNRGLSPKSFLRSKNNYNYTYLERYDTMAEARRARDSQYNGRYKDKTWVFRVVGK